MLLQWRVNLTGTLETQGPYSYHLGNYIYVIRVTSLQLSSLLSMILSKPWYDPQLVLDAALEIFRITRLQQ